ncbi:MAG: CHAP domain-containing protein [Acetobacteraceae bacterium]|nr:CHAP domain-containing protein [Acetobacteraceae bacterium]
MGHSPTVGGVAHFGPGVSFAGPLGHVAYVAMIGGDLITIEEYNFGYTSPYDSGHCAYHHPQRVLHPSEISNFIHVV